MNKLDEAKKNYNKALEIDLKNDWCKFFLFKLKLIDGAPARIRTADLLITNQLLYQLSYKGTFSTKALYKMYLLNSIHLKQIMKLNNEELIVRFKL